MALCRVIIITSQFTLVGRIGLLLCWFWQLPLWQEVCLSSFLFSHRQWEVVTTLTMLYATELSSLSELLVMQTQQSLVAFPLDPTPGCAAI